jgi:hypothetical protein
MLETLKTVLARQDEIVFETLQYQIACRKGDESNNIYKCQSTVNQQASSGDASEDERKQAIG